MHVAVALLEEFGDKLFTISHDKYALFCKNCYQGPQRKPPNQHPLTILRQRSHQHFKNIWGYSHHLNWLVFGEISGELLSGGFLGNFLGIFSNMELMSHLRLWGISAIRRHYHLKYTLTMLALIGYLGSKSIALALLKV